MAVESLRKGRIGEARRYPVRSTPGFCWEKMTKAVSLLHPCQLERDKPERLAKAADGRHASDCEGVYFSSDKVELKVATATVGKAAGVSQATIDVLKYLVTGGQGETWTETLTWAFGTTLRGGHLPPVLKTSKLTLIPKTGGGYRPIAVAETILTIMHKVLAISIKPLVSGNVMKTQLAVGLADGLAVGAYGTDMMYAKCGRVTGHYVLSLDVRNAFNTVSTEAVVQRLATVGAPRDLCQYVANWLQNRVLLWKGGRKACSRGLPQGDPLSALLFALTVDEVYAELKTLTLHVETGGLPHVFAWADDVVAFMSCRNDEETREVNEILSRIVTKGLEMGLEFRPDKCTLEACDDAGGDPGIVIGGQPVQLGVRGSVRFAGCPVRGPMSGGEYMETGDMLSEVRLWMAEMPLQAALHMTRVSFLPMKDIWIGAGRFRKEACSVVDNAVYEMVRERFSYISGCGLKREVVFTPTRQGGMGLRSYCATYEEHLCSTALRVADTQVLGSTSAQELLTGPLEAGWVTLDTLARVREANARAKPVVFPTDRRSPTAKAEAYIVGHGPADRNELSDAAYAEALRVHMRIPPVRRHCPDPGCSHREFEVQPEIHRLYHHSNSPLQTALHHECVSAFAVFFNACGFSVRTEVTAPGDRSRVDIVTQRRISGEKFSGADRQTRWEVKTGLKGVQQHAYRLKTQFRGDDSDVSPTLLSIPLGIIEEETLEVLMRKGLLEGKCNKELVRCLITCRRFALRLPEKAGEERTSRDVASLAWVNL
jgi:hypothetical protein